jgi:outer membrane protein OmpA-like peptidoglycan-associated protein
MITIRRLRCAAAAMGLVVGVSVVLSLPQRVLAQARVADDAAGAVGLSGMAEGAASRPGPGIHVEMAQTARSGRKPVGSIPPATMAFKPATIKPLPEAAGEDAAGQEPAAEPAAKTSRPQGRMPAPAVAEPALSQEAVVTRPSDRTSGNAAADGATPGNATPENEAPENEAEGVVTQKEENPGDQQAALPPASAPAGPSAVAQLAFAPETATLSAEAKGTLKDLAVRFPAHDEGARLQLMAYASGEGMSTSKARRLSLARALSVREYLIANGIDGTRMDVRALGDEAARSPGGSPAGSPANRVDITMIRR